MQNLTHTPCVQWTGMTQRFDLPWGTQKSEERAASVGIKV